MKYNFRSLLFWLFKKKLIWYNYIVSNGTKSYRITIERIVSNRIVPILNPFFTNMVAQVVANLCDLCGDNLKKSGVWSFFERKRKLLLLVRSFLKSRCYRRWWSRQWAQRGKGDWTENIETQLEGGRKCSKSNCSTSVSRADVKYRDCSLGLDTSVRLSRCSARRACYAELLCYWAPRVDSCITYLCVLRFLSLFVQLGTAVRIAYTRVNKSTYLWYFVIQTIQAAVELPDGTFRVMPVKRLKVVLSV